MDAVDPEIIHRMYHAAEDTPGVEHVTRLRARWLGHRLYADAAIIVDDNLSVKASHEISRRVTRALQARIPHLEEVNIHVEPHNAGNEQSDG